MFMIESRFRVANGMEAEVRAAFLARPGLVDRVTGFLGMEVFAAADDACVFHLVTRWSDRESYDTWHRGDAHRASHAFMPRGLKLDAAFTRLTVLHRLEPVDTAPQIDTAIADAAPALAAWLADAATTYAALLSPDGQRCTFNGALADRLSVSLPIDPVELAPLLTNDDGQEVTDRIARLRLAGERGIGEPFLMNFVAATHSPFTLRCWMDVQPGYVLLFGEDADRNEDRLRDQLLATNNQLAVLAREREQARQQLEETHRELARAHAELASTLETLDSSYWYIRRVNEVLPICMACGAMKSGDTTWQAAREFLMEHAQRQFLSHGYCPTCADLVLAQLDAEDVSP